MKRSMRVRFIISFLLLLTLLSPMSALAMADGKKHFKKGMKHEIAEEWDKAVEEYAIAVSEAPDALEYKMHLIRALFLASQMYIKKGAIAAKENDYDAAYVAYRRAYAFDPTNELAKSEMDRMVRLQQALKDPAAAGTGTEAGKVKLVPTGYVAPKGPVQDQVPQKLEKLRDIPFPSGVDLQFIIKELARDLDLNVLFDVESFRTAGRKTYIDLKNVTAARALDYIFLQEGLFFQKVGPRTILVATQAQRTKFQQLVLRTFYLANAAPKDVAKVVQTAIPAQPGRSQTIVLTDDSTNSVTIRDTEENIRLIGKLIASLDKDRAEVVMDVAIYEVNKNDLLRFGNQIGGGEGTIFGQLGNLGGIAGGAANFAGNFAGDLATSIASGVLIPQSVISAYQSKGVTKLIASTQIHAFNNEDSSARIGQRVPVQTAQIVNGTNNIPGQNNGYLSNVINYEQVGLTLKFKPIVFPNQDVQVAMEIESKDVLPSSDPLVPTFTERTIKGTARIQNNKTLLLASVASGSEKERRAGLPFISWLPYIGRLFSTPIKDNSQIDIVIAVTPRVIRAPAILPEDEAERPTGSLAVPTNGLLEAMIIEEEKEELLAMARRMPTNSVIALPDRTAAAPEYVKSDPTAQASGTAAVPATNGSTVSAAAKPVDTVGAGVTTVNVSAKSTETGGIKLQQIDNGVKTLKLNQTSDVVTPQPDTVRPVEVSAPAVPDNKTETAAPPSAQVSFGVAPATMKTGEKVKIPVIVQGSEKFRSAVIGLKFDSRKIAVRSVSLGDIFGADANGPAAPFLNQNGKMFVSLAAKDGSELNLAGTLAFVEIEALADGVPELAFERDVLNFLTPAGKNFVTKVKE